MRGAAVKVLGEVDSAGVDALLGRFGTSWTRVADDAPIPATYWGDPEAGLAAGTLYARRDTPVHSLLHELGHYVCASPSRRAGLWRDARAGEAEECAVCYLQVLLAGRLPGMGRPRCLDDMDAWGYSFREGASRAWFAGDGRLARDWLAARGVIDERGGPTWRLRGDV